MNVITKVVAVAMVCAMALLGMAAYSGAHAATPSTTTQCTASAKWVMGQEKAAHIKHTNALRSNADALAKYPSCSALSPQLLNVVVAKDKTVNADGRAVWTHWTPQK